MDYGATISTTEGHEHTCDYCGAKISVSVAKQSGHNEKEDYNCPECNKRYFTRASLPIMPQNVKVISPRTDGKTDNYQNSDLD